MKKEFGIAVKAVIYNKGKFLVLFKSDQEDVNPNTFDIPGGRVNFGEKLEDALDREVMEECGLKIKPLGITDAWTFVKDDNFQLAGITYVCEALTTEVKLSEEHSSFEWANPTDRIFLKKYPDWLVNSIRTAEKMVKG